MSERVEKWGRKEHMRQRVTFLMNCMFRYSQHLLEWLPYKKKRICCVTLTRKGYTDNMMYVAQALLTKYPDIEIVWVTKYPQTCERAAENGVRVVAYHTIEHFYLQFTSKIIISDDSLYHGLIKRRKQIYFNLWHGGINYKQLGEEGLYFEDELMRKLFKMRNPSPDYMAAGSRFFAENMKNAFGFEKTVFLESGLPRNDVLFDKTSFSGKVKRFYNIEDKKVILYAPTFRERKNNAVMEEINFGQLAETLHQRYGGEWVALYRAHYFVQDAGIDSENVINVSGYENMQELLIDTDILISDYSSCMWDFSFLYRPIIVYAPDENTYCEKDRGLTAAGKRMPYPKAKNMEELTALAEKHDFDADVEKLIAHHREMGAYDTGNAIKCITDLIISKINE
ncbi:MAG: CDP-glycerol glycerophosphotransferase family protein [Lachnospiraceae bacterium]|nr:CDP-glycerol glycerophosphotransferase family protein [Lachnospiraceae bacterium]